MLVDELRQAIEYYYAMQDPPIDTLLRAQNRIAGLRFSIGEEAKKVHDEAVIKENAYKLNLAIKINEYEDQDYSHAASRSMAEKELAEDREAYKLLEARYQGLKITLQTSGDVLSGIQQRISVLKKEQETLNTQI